MIKSSDAEDTTGPVVQFSEPDFYADSEIQSPGAGDSAATDPEADTFDAGTPGADKLAFFET